MKKKTVLVVEDNEKNLKLFRTLLEANDFRVVEALDAERGLEILNREMPDLVLMDIQLPGMNGYEATRKIKDDPRFGRIPVLALTAYAMQGDREKAIQSGCDGYISKPIDTRAFIENIEIFLEGRAESEPKGKKTAPSLKRKILIVDDEPRNQKVLKAMLPEERFDALTADDGEEGLALALAEQPDVILLDIMMPGIDGFEVARRLKKDDRSKNIPIILVTALDEVDSRINGLEAGAEEFLSKPVRPMELLARISSMLQLKDYRDQLSVRRQCELDFSETGTKTTRVPKKSFTSPIVLLVEDNAKDAEIIQQGLAGQPFDVRTVPDGEKALARLLSDKIDLVLLDILLPDINGFEVCRRMRSMEKCKDTPVIALTCLDDLENRVKGIESGVDDYLVKPVNSRELRARIKILLEKKRQVDTLRMHYETALNSAIIDWLTGLYNHGYFKKFLHMEIQRARRHGYPVTLLMIDVDDFKDYNDRFGHSTGDIILRDLAQHVRNSIREVDLAARYGGDEFAVILPYTDSRNGVKVAERIQNSIRNLNFTCKKEAALNAITFSIGVAMFSIDADSEDGLIQAADQRMYAAKQKGKNRVCVTDSEEKAVEAGCDA